ncbi:SixA phosphatase family protein [Desulfosediminicola ganghwensis]|uniref:SixA phosphatase family protein n=1 Tax=Desulfosediminicola ganghwensis TaxID=2569540 RepID=UPI0010AB884F|nr:histidine phosphatase family protein [Desulfosediminicola ganghwensis]
MKELYLIRHAKSSWSNPGLDDIERPLNKRGKRDAPFMGSRLKKYGVRPDMVYTSPAKRARKTAGTIAECVGYPQERIQQRGDIYTADMNKLLLVVRQTENRIRRLFLVGHNYVLTDFAEYLTNEPLGNVPTCGIVGIAFDIDGWHQVGEAGGHLQFFDYPKRHPEHSRK